MPTLGWATTAWDGEQFQGVGDDTNVAELLPLDFFQKNCGLMALLSLKHEGVTPEKGK